MEHVVCGFGKPCGGGVPPADDDEISSTHLYHHTHDLAGCWSTNQDLGGKERERERMILHCTLIAPYAYSIHACAYIDYIIFPYGAHVCVCVCVCVCAHMCIRTIV